MVFKEIVQGGEPIKEHKIINILQNHPNLTPNLKEYPLADTDMWYSTNQRLVCLCQTKNRKHLLKNKGVFHLKTQIHCIKIILRET